MYKQYQLTYDFNSLEPYIDALTMETHYSKHHAAYTKNLNDAVEKAGIENKSIETLLASLGQIGDDALRTAIRNNGGGFYNHNLYFSAMSPNGGGEPEGDLAKAIADSFENFSLFKEKLTALALGQFGSGWAWLSAGPNGELKLSSSPNQDNPIIEGSSYIPILGIDVWEHAYYLKYKNVRADYVKEYFNVIDWKSVAEYYKRARNT
jgi:Fe-Mn family superoxide dismutase